MEERLATEDEPALLDDGPGSWLPDFDAFYDREFDAVAALAYVLSGSGIASDDLAQEAFLAAYRRWPEIGRYDNPGAWVRRVVINRSVSSFRRGVTLARVVTRLGAGMAPIPEISPDSVAVWQAVRRLPARQAQAVALHYLEDLTLDSVAQILDCSVETVRTHLSRARKTLAIHLDTTEADDDPR